jgi:hypothetical protein
VRRWVVGFMPVLIVLCLLSLAAIKSRLPPRKPDAAHVAMVQQKQAAWLEKHPLLLRISHSEIEGLPGDMVTNVCWHVMKTVTGHKTANGSNREAGRAADRGI